MRENSNFYKYKLVIPTIDYTYLQWSGEVKIFQRQVTYNRRTHPPLYYTYTQIGFFYPTLQNLKNLRGNCL